jgi:hypothetical protein
MAPTTWTNSITGERLDRGQVGDVQARSRRLYEANTHLFEDEWDALVALGVVSLVAAA